MANGNAQKKPGPRKAAHPRGKTLKRATAFEILGIQDECQLWNRLLHSDDDRVVLQALKYLTDRRDGKLYPAVNPYQPADPDSGKKDPVPDGDLRMGDLNIHAALKSLLPPPSSQITVAEARSLTTDERG